MVRVFAISFSNRNRPSTKAKPRTRPVPVRKGIREHACQCAADPGAVLDLPVRRRRAVAGTSGYPPPPTRPPVPPVVRGRAIDETRPRRKSSGRETPGLSVPRPFTCLPSTNKIKDGSYYMVAEITFEIAVGRRKPRVARPRRPRHQTRSSTCDRCRRTSTARSTRRSDHEDRNDDARPAPRPTRR